MAGMFKDERKALRKAREGGYVASQSALDALIANLRTTQKGVGQDYTQSAARTLEAMRRVQGRVSAKADQAVTKAENAVRNQYGSAIAGGTVEQRRPAEVAAEVTAKEAKAGVKAGTQIAKAGQTALAIQKAATTEASESAAYLLAQALNYRARDDARLVYEQKAALQQMRLQYKLDLKNQKAMYDYTQEQEQKALGGRQGATDLGSSLAGVMPTLRLWMDAHPDGTLQEFLAAHQDLIGGNPNMPMYLAEVFATMQKRNLFSQDLGYGATVDAIVDSMLTMNPEWRKFRPALEKYVLQSLKTSWDGMATGALEPPPNPNAPYGAGVTQVNPNSPWA